MQISVKNSLLSNLNLKLISVIVGYLFWALLSQSHTTTTWLQVPLCFYNNDQTTTLDAPEKISIQVQGKRSDLMLLDRENLALHINILSLANGHNAIDISGKDLLLPGSITVVNSSPINPVVVVSHNEPKQELCVQELA